MPGQRSSALNVPTSFWARVDVLDALDERDFGRLFTLIRQHAGASQSRIGAAVDLSQGTISDIVRGKRRITAIDVVLRVADGLGMPEPARQRLGLAVIGPRIATGRARLGDPDVGDIAQVLTVASIGARDVDYFEQSVFGAVAKYPMTGPSRSGPASSLR